MTIQEMQGGEALSAGEVCKILGIGFPALRAWLSKPYFPAVKIGKRDYVVFRTTLMNWLSDPKNILEFKRLQEEDRMYEAQ